MQEEWRPVVGAEEHYEVSNLGRVKRVTPPGPRLLAGGLRGGYRRVSIYIDGQQTRKSIHVMVAEAFIGPRPEGMSVCHNDGNPLNNRLDNLRYDTHSANIQDSVKHGTHPWATKTHCPRNHEYTPENTRWARSKSGGLRRMCRECGREECRKRRAAAKQQAA